MGGGSRASIEETRRVLLGRCVDEVTLAGAAMNVHLGPALIVLPWPWRIVPGEVFRLEATRDFGSMAVVAEVDLWRHEFERVCAELLTLKQQLAAHQERR